MNKLITVLFCALILTGCSSKPKEVVAPTITPTTSEITVKVGEKVDVTKIFEAKDSAGNVLEVKLVDGSIDTSDKMGGKTTEYFVQAVDSNKKEVRATLKVTVEK